MEIDQNDNVGRTKLQKLGLQQGQSEVGNFRLGTSSK